ncbi:hypothetical protein [Sphaerisporangium sp. NPDC051011]|uniref:hypothetical protein n=1 Tax=Sphaerisporangium sp. NPDC051011 TaxID=3155792 RepID=UPI0033C1C17F
MTTPFGTGAGRRVDLGKLRQRVHRKVVQAGDRAFESPPRGDKRPPRVVSEQERHGVPPTDTEASSPLGVGPSSGGGRAETMAHREMSRRRGGAEGPSTRPYGHGRAEHGTGAGVQETIEESSPYPPPGGQGG